MFLQRLHLRLIGGGGYGGDASNHYIYTLRLDPKGVTIDKPQVVGWDTTIPEQNVPVD